MSARPNIARNYSQNWGWRSVFQFTGFCWCDISREMDMPAVRFCQFLESSVGWCQSVAVRKKVVTSGLEFDILIRL